MTLYLTESEVAGLVEPEDALAPVEACFERLARGEEPRSLDKEYVRRWLAGEAKWNGDGPPPTLPDDVRVEAARRYIASYEVVTGRKFQPDTREPVSRIAAALGAK